MEVYPLTPDRVTELRVSRDVLLSGGGAFIEVRRAKTGDANPKRTWSVLHDHINLTEWQTLLTFFEARSGKWETFTFTDPETNTPYTVRFESDTIRAEKPLGREDNALFVVNLKLREVL